MQRLTVLILVLAITGPCSYAQLAAVSGNIRDTTEKKSLVNSSVILLRRVDSVLVRATRSDKNGDFFLKDLPSGKFLLRVTYPSYADYVEELELKDSLVMRLPAIALILKSQLLQEVIVNGNRSAIHIKGDTVEFKADSFYTRAGANIEELLKRLPGIEVGKDGSIKAQGQTVPKILVDGEEFFGDDPTLVTQNLLADMVDKVQVYDKKSDQAAFTGIDDGERTKTINIKLKESKKNGFFGKLSAGAATEGYHDLQAMLNVFRNKEKFALYGILSNTGKTGLNWQDMNNYGQSDAGNIEYDEIMDSYIFTGAYDELQTWDGKFSGQGLPSVKTGGVHYNNKWDNNRQSGNINYKFMQLDIKNSGSTNSENFIRDTTYNNKSTEISDNQILRHRANGNYEIAFDSTSSMKITFDGGADHKITHSQFTTEARIDDSVLANQGIRNTSATGDIRTLNGNILWRKKLAKKGRSLSVNFKENYNSTATDGTLFSDNSFYSHGAFSYRQITDQHKKSESRNLLLDSRITYTEPLSASSYLSGTYGISLNNSSSDRNSFNRSPDGKYDQFDTLYSNDYRFNLFTQQGGLSYALIKKKFRFVVGNNLGATHFLQDDLHADTSLKRSFINWHPSASFTYIFNQQKRLAFRYDGSTSQPSIRQIQPKPVNDDPLNISIGNPGLRPQFRNSIYLNFYEYKTLTQRSINSYLNYGFTQNAIISSSTVDPSGKRENQFLNLGGIQNQYLSGYFGYNFKWKKPAINVGWSANASWNKYGNIVNQLLNSTSSGNYTLGINLSRSKDNFYDASLICSGTYTESRSTINSNVVTRYKTWSINPNLEIYLPLKIQLHGDAAVSLREKTSVFDGNNNVVLLNAWIGRKFLKNDALLIKAAGNDLLDQNIGFNRYVSSNFISQNTYTSIRRYFMLSISWNFTRSGTPAPHGN